MDSPFPTCPDRRRFVLGLAAGGALAGAWPRRSWALRDPSGPVVLAGTDFGLAIGETAVDFTGRARTAITVNGSLPAPLLRWREGDTVTLRVRNALPAGSAFGDVTSIHWHGLLLPANMDGVPGLSFAGIRRGEGYEYRFTVRQSGTYWYHSHSAFQEQSGLYGPIIIDPAGPDPHAVDRDYVLMFSDWTDLDGAALYRRLKQMPAYDNHARLTVGDFLADAGRDGVVATARDRLAWARMRMTPTDLSDVDANTYTYLLNGTTSLGNWTGLFRHGEKLRLRLINGSAMTHFDVRIPGLKLTVVAADGQPVHPVTVDELRIATAETFDVIVEPRGQDAFTIFAQDLGRTGFVAGTLAVREGVRAPVPPVDPRPRLSMADMGHAHGAHGKAAEGGCGAAMGEGGCGAAMGEGGCGAAMHGGHGAARSGADTITHPPGEARSPFVDMQVAAAAPRLDDPGIGLRDNGRKVLNYSMLRSTFPDPDGRDPGREIELHLTGHMERFAWGVDGERFADAAPLRLRYGERVRISLVNDTMMTHPIHLHGMWSDLEDEHGGFLVRKHTVDMPPGTRRSYRVRADALGHWAWHCHLLYHMEAGMMRVVQVHE